MAGGQSLGPMLNLRLVEPERVIDISGVPELRRIDRADGSLVIGACVTHADIEDGRVPDVANGMMARVAAGIAYRAVRNRGTIGRQPRPCRPGGRLGFRSVGARGRSRDRLARAQDAGASRLANSFSARSTWRWPPTSWSRRSACPLLPSSARWGYVKHCRKVGEFAEAIGAVVIDPEGGCGRAVIGAVEAAPVVIEDARILFGGAVGPSFASRFDASAADAILAAAGMSDPVDRHVHVTVLRRAIDQASGRGRAKVQDAA